METRSDLHVGVRPRVVRSPHFLAAVDVERRDVASHPEFPAGVSNDDLVLDDDGRPGQGLAYIDVPDFRSPCLLAGCDVDRDEVRVEEAVNDLSLGERRPAIDHVAARDAHRTLIGMRLEDPFDGAAWLGEIDGN